MLTACAQTAERCIIWRTPRAASIMTCLALQLRVCVGRTLYTDELLSNAERMSAIRADDAFAGPSTSDDVGVVNAVASPQPALSQSPVVAKDGTVRAL